MNFFRSIEEFYEKRGGRFSGESQYGVSNYPDQDRDRPPQMRHRFRVCHVHSTGDWYAHCEDNRGFSGFRVLLLGTLQNPSIADRINSLDHAEHSAAQETVTSYFHDWARGDEPGRPFSYFINRIELFNKERGVW